MRFQTELIPATLLRRYKRFLADIRLEDGCEVTAHCPNPGSMMGLADEGLRVWVEPNDDPKKKLKYGLRIVEADGAMVVVDTGVANRVVKEALWAQEVPGLTGEVKAEVKYGENSRADFLVMQDGQRIWVEVKSVTLSRQKGRAEFPDAKTARGAKHLSVLADQVAKGDRAVMLYLVSRDDCIGFAPAGDIDPTYAKAEAAARAAGVEIMVYPVEITPKLSPGRVVFVPRPLQQI
ncbi:DNA/RNA nuclease SfsA [Celeribacter neptunius]|uniref:Sugar fermentation stimulation protein homolog n=1 Tax=Celeribacter neptunius TaxID=588602 RepID=A0A1I3WXY2_9RHOB|nr:DNA/RNA nuclease SfsA [Celeribacter neptunius]SFK11999.1 sugar fermentation stimulation protein A [Celeribacter neptunius]